MPSRLTRHPRRYDPGMSDRKIRVTVTLDPHLAAYAERLVEDGKAPSVSAFVNDALSERVERGQAQREAVEGTDRPGGHGRRSSG